MADPAEIARGWQLWNELRPTDETALYWWRIPTKKILGLVMQPEWCRKMHFCGMGYADNEWWPPFSHWDGYRRTVPAGTQWRIAEDDANENDIVWRGLKLANDPWTGKPPKLDYTGCWIGAPPWSPERLWIRGPFTDRSFTDAAKMQAAWNNRAQLKGKV